MILDSIRTGNLCLNALEFSCKILNYKGVFISEYLLINLGVKLLNPNKSSVTKICPSQCLDAPMPIVGTGIDFVII